MSAYDALAGSYDELTYDVPYQKIEAFFESALRRFRVDAETVLDLACGTGSLAILLAQNGFQVIGVDMSEEMLTQASQKSAGMEHPPIWVHQQMQRLRLPQKVDAAVCCLDSINYLTNPEHCRKTFQRVYQSLNSGGMLMFDINTPYKLRGMDGQVFLDETDDTYCVWRASLSGGGANCVYCIDLFQRADENWVRSTEFHTEHIYTQEELTQYLREAGFRKIHCYGDLSFRKPKETELRIYFVALK